MNRVLWGLAIAVDFLGILSAGPLFASDPPPASTAWGIVVLVIFGGLLVLLLKPQVFGTLHRMVTAAKVLCIAVPASALIGSLDSGTISGLEASAIVVAVLVGWLNWAAVQRHVVHELTKAAS